MSTLDQDFLYAVEHKSLQEIQDMVLHQGANIQARDWYGDGALHLAIRRNDLAIVHFLIHQKADLQARNEEGCTPLSTAISSGMLEAAKTLLEQGVSPDCRDKYSRTPLHDAVLFLSEEEQMIAIELLLSFGASPNALDVQGNTPLHLAASEDYISIAAQLLAAGTLINTQDYQGRTALHIATIANKPSMVEFLMNQGIDPEIKSTSRATAYDFAKGRHIDGIAKYLATAMWVRREQLILQAASRSQASAEPKNHHLETSSVDVNSKSKRPIRRL